MFKCTFVCRKAIKCELLFAWSSASISQSIFYFVYSHRDDIRIFIFYFYFFKSVFHLLCVLLKKIKWTHSRLLMLQKIKWTHSRLLMLQKIKWTHSRLLMLQKRKWTHSRLLMLQKIKLTPLKTPYAPVSFQNSGRLDLSRKAMDDASFFSPAFCYYGTFATLVDNSELLLGSDWCS